MNSNIKYGLLGIVFSSITALMLSGSAAAQFPLPDATAQPETIVTQPAADAVDRLAPRLVDAIPSSSDLSDSKPTAAELRQARAQYRSQKRMERMERNLWAGYEPLRPNWNSIPMMSSRYAAPNTLIVPVYAFPRY